MRLKRSRLKQFYLNSKSTVKDHEGNVSTEYADPQAFQAEIWPGSGKVQAEIYGDKLNYVRNLRIPGIYWITTDTKGITHYVYANGTVFLENDGLSLYCGPNLGPDYRINAIKPYDNLLIEAVKL